MDDKRSRSHDQRLGFMVYRAGLAISRGYERTLNPIGVMPVEAGVLGSLCYGGPNHVRGLARQLGVGRQTIVNVTRTLEQKKWIKRAASDDDARLAIFSISTGGIKKLGDIETLAQAFDAKLREIVGPSNEKAMIEHLGGIVDAPFLAHED
jgi:DNA-binding MarR family transcriptional regulator